MTWAEIGQTWVSDRTWLEVSSLSAAAVVLLVGLAVRTLLELAPPVAAATRAGLRAAETARRRRRGAHRAHPGAVPSMRDWAGATQPLPTLRTQRRG